MAASVVCSTSAWANSPSTAAHRALAVYVADRGGTLVLLAGKRALPLGFPEGDAAGDADPLRKMLPIEDPRVVAPVLRAA